MKARGRKTQGRRKDGGAAPPGRPCAPARPRDSETVASLKRALAEAQEQQAATAEVLKVISQLARRS